jgi:ATP-independent RNA helicase DbpA
MRYIREEVLRVKRTTLVSATEMSEFPAYLHFSEIGQINFLDQSTEPDITYFSVPISTATKFERLYQLLCSFQGEPTMVFCNFREATASIHEYLNENGYDAVIYHGGMEQEERERALIKFRNGSYYTLICTDLGSRGLDIPEIQHVVHFQYPQSKEAFIHRNGRTARMKANGSAYLLINSDDETPEYIDVPNNQYKIKKEGILENLLTTDELAIYLRKTPKWVRDNRVTLGIPSLRIGKHLRFHQKDIDDWLRQCAI